MRARAARGRVECRKGCQGIPINLHMLKADKLLSSHDFHNCHSTLKMPFPPNGLALCVLNCASASMILDTRCAPCLALNVLCTYPLRTCFQTDFKLRKYTLWRSDASGDFPVTDTCPAVRGVRKK